MQAELKSILIVEDNPVLLCVLTEIFSGLGWSVRVATHGSGALEEIRAEAPEILLSDLNMPGVSGFELLSITRLKFPAIKVVAMSGAYSGSQVPPGVAADAFYAKGGRLADRYRRRSLVGDPDRVAKVEGACLAPSIRCSNERPGDPVDDMLRVFPAEPISADECSPAAHPGHLSHCRCVVQIATVHELCDMDLTLPCSLAPTRQRGESAHVHYGAMRSSEGTVNLQ